MKPFEPSQPDEPRFHKSVEKVLQSYASHGGINHEGVNLLTRGDYLNDLHEVLFPGIFLSPSFVDGLEVCGRATHGPCVRVDDTNPESSPP